MKSIIKTILVLTIFTATLNAQEVRPLPQISVNGEGRIKAVPDQAFISIGVESKGNNATEVKKENDLVVEKVVQYLKKSKLQTGDYQTKRVALNPQYDYDKKKYNYVATQTIEILVKDLSLYDGLMAGLVDSGINTINSVEFRSSKLAQYQSEARKKAIQDAQSKAQDYVFVLGQKVGKALMITDNSQPDFPHPMMFAMAKAADESQPRETLAIGEIDIVAIVSVSFLLE